MTLITVTLFKDRQKFSAAHFTMFEDGEVERLHGHNYRVSVSFKGRDPKMGMLFPFHHIKPELKKLCDQWDERILIPLRSEWVEVLESGSQCEVTVSTPQTHRFYSFPKDEVIGLSCDNVTSENLAILFAQKLADVTRSCAPGVLSLSVAVSESSGQEVSVELDLS